MSPLDRVPRAASTPDAGPDAAEPDANRDRAAAVSRRSVWRLAPGLALVGLAGCGFRLRQPVALPFRRMALAGFNSDMERALRVAAGPAVEWMTAPAQAEVLLVAAVSVREKTVAAFTPTRRVSEFQLRARLRYRAQTPAGRVLLPESELVLVRELSYNETYALGKEQEEARLYSDMETDIGQQVLRRLGTVRL